MQELEETHCEVRKIVELHATNWHYQNSPLDDDARPVPGSFGSNESADFMGGFLDDVNYAWLSCGSKLMIVNVKTGATISTWTFKERVSCLSQFPGQPGQIPLLLVGLDNDANKIKDSYGMVCIFDCTISQVLRAIRMPAGVEQLCVLHGGAEWEEIGDKRMDNILIESHGMACVALKNLDYYIIDLKRNSWEKLMNSPLIDEANPAEIDSQDSQNTSTRYKSNRERHTVHNLMNKRLERYIGFNRDEFESSPLYQEKMTMSLICSRKIGCLISGCLGRIIIWQNDGVVRWISQPMDDNMAVSHLVLLEPTDDPRPFCYLWAAYQEEAPTSIPPILRMYAMLFERKYSDKGMNLYFNLEGEPSLKFELEVKEKKRITSLYPIARANNQDQSESGNKKGEDNLLLINIEGKTILFDLNQWYKEQMPRIIGECQNSGAILSSYQSESELSLTDTIVSCAYVPSTLKEFPCTTSTTPEEFFFPNSLSLQWVELGIQRLTFWMARGVQAQLLREMAMAGPIIMIQPSKTFHRCITTGLVSFSSEASNNDTLDSQRDALLTLCLEQRWTVFLLRCAREWSDGSAAYLYPAFLRWCIQRASSIQFTAHQLCIPLFDQSGSIIGETEIRTLRFFSQQMECLCNIVDNLPIETDYLDNQRRTLHRISTYLQILLWFYDVGLLPETQDIDEESLPISFILKIPYPAEKLALIYAEKRKQYSQNGSKEEKSEAVMFIDELITKECPALRSQWEQESNEVIHSGNYPPPSLQSLLRSCLIDCHHSDTNEMENKHQIIIYLLMDLVMLLQGSCPGVDQLIKYPSAFKLSPSLIKLTQAFWLLDHEDYQGFLDIMTGQFVSESDLKEWHHKLVMRTLLRSNQNKLALIYIRIRKPPLSSIDDQGTVIHLTVEHGLVQSAFHHRPPSHYHQLLKKFFYACKIHGKLNEILHLALNADEEESFLQFLNEEKCEETRLIYYLQHSRYSEANNASSSNQSFVGGKKNDQPASFSIFQAYNTTLPEITRRFTTNLIHRNTDSDNASRYPRPMSHFQNRIGTRDIYENVIKKAKETFIRDDRSQIPFITAPCLSLKTNSENNESNCVLFVERARKTFSKRTLREMKDSETQDDELETRKRRKILESNDIIDDASIRDISIDMMFGTPLVKRKNQISNTKDIPSETPQSILKIRQMIRDSMSPSGKVTSSEGEKILEIEKKPRQIRFSINQLAIDNSKSDRELIDEEVERLDTTESIKSESATPSNNSGDEEDEYFSPNDNTKSLSESTVLSDSSSYQSKSLSGPRPRPGLRRNNIDSSFDGIRKLSPQYSTMTTESSPNSAKISSDLSITSNIISNMSNIVSSTFIDSYTPIVPQHRSQLQSMSIYDSTVLSSNTSIELSLHDISESSPKPESISVDEENKKINLTNKYISPTHANTEIAKMNSLEINKTEDIFGDKTNANVANELTIEANHQTIVDDCSVEPIENNEENNILPLENTFKHENSPCTDDKNFDEDQTENNELDISNKNIDKNEEDVCGIICDDASVMPSNDYDDELLALKYDEEDGNDDVFKSLCNSLERDHHQEKSFDQYKIQNNSPRKIINPRFNVECNITDDESSRSVDQSDATDILHGQNTEINEMTLRPSAPVLLSMGDDANITDDKSDDSCDSSKISIECVTDRNMNEFPEIQAMRDVSSDADSEIVLRYDRGESIESEIAQSNDETSVASTNPIPEIIPEEKEEISTPVRMTRSRRASSVVPIVQEPSTETPEIQKLGRTRRANSLAKETHSTPIMTLSTTPSGLDSSAEISGIKRGRGRRSTSLIKEVLTTSKLIEPSLTDVVESPVRRSARRAASVQKDISETMNTPTKNINPSVNSPMVTSNSTDVIEPVKKITRSKRATSANRDLDTKVRKTRATSVSEEIDESTMNVKENLIKPKKTRAASVSKESTDKSTSNETKSKRTRTTSVKKDVSDETSSNDIALGRRTRAASVCEENTEELIPRRQRAVSLTSDVSIELPARRTRASSLTKDIIEDITAVPRRKTRASSLTKESVVEGETTTKRVTRRKGLTSKNTASETLKTTRSSILQDTIPEEDSEETIFTAKRVRTVSPAVEDSHTAVTRARAIAVIPEEKEEEQDKEEVSTDVLKKKEKKRAKGSTRDRRAASVDLPQMEVKRRTRGLNKNASTDDRNGAEGPLEIDEKNKSTGKTTKRRITRATSETKELKDVPILERPSVRDGTKLSQTQEESDDSNEFESIEEARNVRGNRLDIDDPSTYFLSPPAMRCHPTSSSQPRRPIANFIPPITEEEEKMKAEVATNKLIKSNNSKQTHRTSSMLGYRTKFVIRSQNKLK